MPCYQESFQSCKTPAVPKRHPKASAPLSFPVILGVVVGQTVQDEDLPPLCALIQSCQQFVDVLRVQIQQVAVRVGLTDLRQRGHSICHHLGEKNSLLAEPEGLGRDWSRAGHTWGSSCRSVSYLSPLGCSTTPQPTCRAQSSTGRNREPGHHKRLCRGRSWRWHSQGTAPPCRLHQLQGMLSFTAEVPKPPVALFFHKCVPLAQFPMAHGLAVIQKRAGRCLAASSSAAALAGHRVWEQTNNFPKMGNSC